MLRITSTQLTAFDARATRAFEDALVAHLVAFVRTAAAEDEARLFARVRLGVQRAQAYGIESERGVAAYVAVMSLHGDAFDEDPGLPWTAVLKDGSLGPETRASRLLEAALAHAPPRSVVERRPAPPPRPPPAPPAASAPPGRAIVEVRGGPSDGTRVVLEREQSLTVGRTPRAQLVVAADPALENLHFRIEWRDGELWAVAAGRRGDLAIDGVSAAGAVLRSGSWVRAGNTDVLVYFEHGSPTGGSGPASVDAALGVLARLRAAPRLFAVVDSARGARVLRLLRESVDAHVSLYDGLGGRALAHCAPYLVELRRDSSLLDSLVREGWGRHWAVYVESDLRLRDLRRHLRRLVVVRADGQPDVLFLRFYDSATLGVLFEHVTPRQRELIQSGASRFHFEGDDGSLVAFPPEAQDA